MGYALILEELDGDGLTVRLEGPLLPEEELTERIRTNVARHVYPGAREATLHVLSVENRPVVMKGLLSDKETGVEGMADAARGALTAMARRGGRARLLYRNLDLIGVLSRADFSEEDRWETRYELEFEVSRAGGAVDAGAGVDLEARLRERLERLVEEMERAWEELPEEIREFVDPLIETEVEELEGERLEVEFELDPWLEARLDAEEVWRRARVILELIGNERALNVDDKVRAAARMAEAAAGRVRDALSDWDGSGMGAIDILTDAGNIDSVVAILGDIRMLF